MGYAPMGGRTDRRAHTLKDLAVGVACMLVAGSLLLSLTGATRNLSRAQVCTDNLRQLFTGLTAYVSQYNSYPPNAPYPPYISNQFVGGLSAGGWDPSIGWVMTYGMAMEPPARDTATGHFKWYVLPEPELPGVCVCPARSPSLLTMNPELDQTSPLESFVFQYALSYQTAGTCRSACPIKTEKTATSPGTGGRDPTVPDPTSSLTARPYDNSQRGNPYVWLSQRKSGAAPDDPTPSLDEIQCYIQAVNPSEVASPGRTYYMADSRDYRPYKNADGSLATWPPAGTYNGWYTVGGTRILLGSRHYGYANVMYLDGRVTRDNQSHVAQWNMDYSYATSQAGSSQWRAATFSTNIPTAGIRGQVHIMPVLSVVGWEYFFDSNGLKAR